jgi:hypothetical protein
MAWSMEGRYFETCSCDAVCPCTWSALTARATLDRCNAFLAFHIDTGDIEGVDVNGLNWAMILDTPPVMSDGNWRVGILLDDAATDAQAGALGSVLGGEKGGPPAMLGPLIGEMLGVQSAPFDFSADGASYQVRVGDYADVAVGEFSAPGMPEPVRLTNVFHPAASTLTVAPATRASIAAFGIEFGREGESGFAAPFAWSA